MQGFEQIHDIGFFKNGAPVTFAYRRFVDQDSNHRLHLNKHCEIYVYISGDADYVVEDNYYELRRGDILLINPLEVHKAVLKSECMYERFYILLTSECFPDMLSDPLSNILSKPKGVQNLIRFDTEKREEMISLLFAMNECIKRGESADRVLLLSQMLRFLFEINLALRHTKTDAERGGDRLLCEIMSCIDKNAISDLSLSDMAQTLGISPQYMSSYFKSRVGTTLTGYMQAKRISAAKQLLDSGANVTEACYDCGFNDCSYFIRTFKRFVGMTPLQYKRGNAR